MAVNWADNVEETTTSTGTGTVDLAGATAGNQTFVAGIGTTNTCYYCISSNSEYEVGYGTVTDAATDTLSRDSVLASSNSDALVSFSAGTKNVHLLPPFAIRSTRILDRDRDTKVDTDEGFADEDTIRFDAAGSEMMTLDASNGLKVGSSLEAAITNNGKFRGPDATVGGPTFSFVNDDDTGIYRPGSGQIGFVSNGTERVHIDSNGALFIGDTANAKMTIGLTINQGSNDNEILTFKSGDVNQAYTGATEADTFAVFAKETGAGGGLRVRPETLCRITEFSEHESNGRELDEGERVAVEVLPVLGQSAAAVEPGDGAFDHPTPGLDDEALHPIGSLDDLGLEIGQDAGQGAVKDRPLIGAVGEQFPEKGKQTEQGRQQRETAVAILNVGGGDDAVQQQALRIDQNMPLLALDQLAGIEAVAVDASPLFQRFSHSDCR